MTVFAFETDDSDNPLFNLTDEELARIPYGAAELSAEGKIISYNDTEPDENPGRHGGIVGRDFFIDVARWAGHGLIVDEFRKGVATGGLNVVFDCASSRLTHKVRIHLKVSPILGTFWVFTKRLHRG